MNQKMSPKMAKPPTASNHSWAAPGSLYQLRGSPSISKTANMSTLLPLWNKQKRLDRFRFFDGRGTLFGSGCLLAVGRFGRSRRPLNRRKISPAGMRLALFDNPQEQIFHGRGRVAKTLQAPAVPEEHCFQVS